MADAQVPEDAISTASAWAKSVGDSLLLHQIYYFHSAITAVIALASTELLTRRELSQANFSDRLITDDQVQIVKNLRARISVFQEFLKNHGRVDLFPLADDH